MGVVADCLASMIDVLDPIAAAAPAAASSAQRKVLDEALHDSEQRYRLFFEKNPDGVFSVDAQGRFLVVNPACEALSGYSKAELVGRHFAEICAADQLAATMARFQRLLHEPGYSELETAMIRKDGRRVELWVAGEPVLKEGVPVGMYCTVKDITQRKQFQVELERLVKQRTAALQQTTDQLNAFVFTLAHDFKAPLRAQLAFASILLEEFGSKLGPDGLKYAQRIADAAATQRALVEDLLKQVTANRENLPFEVVDLRGAIDRAQSELAEEIMLRRAQIALGPLEGRVKTNAASLHVILINLLSNALKFVPADSLPEVRIWSEAGRAIEPQPSTQGTAPYTNGNTLRVWIEDNGIGIPAQDQPRLFQAFQRLDPAADYPGTGIGLAIVTKAAERLGGRVGVQSGAGQGSRFWLELPAAN